MSSRKIGLNLVVIVALAALFTGIWALYNRPVSVPDWPERISGLSFSPFRLNQNPQSGRYPSAEQMRTDLELVARHTHSIRTYSVGARSATSRRWPRRSACASAWASGSARTWPATRPRSPAPSASPTSRRAWCE